MRRLTPLIVLVIAAVSFLAFRPSTTTNASAVEGVWKAVHVTTAAGEEIERTTPNLMIFTATHYASVRTNQPPREQLPDDPTDEQLLAAWRPFNASAGTYEVQGNEIHAKVIVAKDPNSTAEQRENTSTFEVDGDTLIRTFGGGAVVRYTRVE
jgi:hypothetical protein